MVDLFNQKIKVKEFDKTVDMAKSAMNINALKLRKEELIGEQNSDGFWENTEKAGVVNKELKLIDSKINKFEKIASEVEDIKALMELCEEADDDGEIENINDEIEYLSGKIEQLKLDTLLKGKYDSLNAIITLHAGAGGTEAQDWVQMLYRMYTRYIERKGFSTKLLDILDGDEAGIKSVTFTAEGDNAYGYLKAEKGIHRLVRISPFDSNSRRHTSFASVEVMPEIVDDEAIQIRPEDLRVDTYRSSGAGGQHVNKTESAIRITHIPTGIVVSCQNERSQIQNREVAMNMLKSKLVERHEAEQLAEAQSIKGDLKKIEWGSQIRSYVFCPYTMVKDHRTNYETGNIQAVMDGDIDEFIVEYLKRA